MNSFLTLGHISNEVADVLKNQLVLANKVRRDLDDTFGKAGAKIGDTANLRMPGRHLVQNGDVMVLADENEISVPVILNKRKHIALAYTNVDRLLTMDQFSDRIIKPRVAQLANQIDQDGFALYKQANYSVGTPGTVPATSDIYLQAGQVLDDNAAPTDEQRYMVTNSKMRAKIIAAEQALFHSNEEISRQHKKGRIGEQHGFKWYMDQNVASHTVGAFAGTIRVNGADQSGASLITDGHTSGASSFKEGDIITIAGVFHVNPQSRQSNGDLQQFRVTRDISDTTGAMTIPISPEIIASGKDQTVDSLPADDALISVVGAASTVTPQGLAFHRDAMALVMADLPMPGAGANFKRVSEDNVAMTMVEQFDIVNYRTIMRIDVLYGWAVLRPELMVRVAS